MRFMFYSSKFNGDISQWDISNVNDMESMFSNSKFNGDISQWYVSNVKNMISVFKSSEFNGDISQWDVSNVKDIFRMFSYSKFNQDLTNWKPYQADINNMFHACKAPIPYWHVYDLDERKLLIDNFVEKQKLNDKLNSDLSVKNKRINKI